MNYGLAGGRSNQGNGFTRYQIAGDPSPYFPVFAAGGGFQASPPAYMMPNSGGPYRYGSLHVNGLINLISDGSVCRPIRMDNTDINGFNINQLLGAATQSPVVGQPVHTRVIMLQNALNQVQAILNHNGEMIYQDTIASPAQMGAVSEGFSGITGTATVTNGSPTVTIVGGPAIASIVLSTSYAYTPDFNGVVVGDVLEIINGGNSQYYRIAAIGLSGGNLANFTVYPNYGATSGSGKTYKIWRTGYGSSSNAVILYNSEDIYLYYAGNVIRNSLGGAGTIECIHVNAKSPFTFQHFMAPSVGGIVGRPAATDIIYFKGFLLYGAGNAVGWSVATFPTDFTTGFGATDFPAEAVNAFQTDGIFLYFERVGDQVFANFTSGIFVVSTTGSVPEFDFIQLPVTAGGTMVVTPDPETYGKTFLQCRGSARGESIMAYRSPSGLQLLQSTTPKRVSTPIEGAQISDRGEVMYSNSMGFFQMMVPNAVQGFAYFWETNEWTLFNFTELGQAFYGLSPDVFPGNLLDIRPRRLGLAAWVASQTRIRQVVSFNEEFEADNPGIIPGSDSFVSWQWTTPIISLGDIYEGFQLGSFRPLLRPAEADIAPVTMLVTLYAGTSPTQMSAAYGPILVDYSLGIPSAIQMPNIAKSDAPYIGFHFQGKRWVELVGVALYPVGTASRR